MNPRLRALAQRVVASSFARSGMFVFAAVILGNAVNYAYLLLLGRLLSILDYGVVISLVSAVLLVNGAGSVVQTVTAKLAADLRAADDAERMSAFLLGINRVAFVVAGGFGLLSLACAGEVSDYLHLDHPEYAAVAGIIAALGFIILFQRGCLQGFGYFRDYAISSVLDVVRTILVVPLTRAFGILGSLSAMLAAMLVSVLYANVALFRHVGGARGKAAPLDLRRMAVTATATGASSFGVAFLMFYDVVLARHFLVPFEAGLYGAAAIAGRVLFTTVSFLPTILLPHISIRTTRGSPVTAILFAAIIVSALGIGPFAVVSAFAPELMIRILAGSRFAAAASLVLPYVLAAGALALANVLSSYAVGRHRFSFVPYMWIIGVLEVTLVSLRHGSAREIVEDILAGHGAVCCMMVIWTVRELTSTRNAERASAV